MNLKWIEENKEKIEDRIITLEDFFMEYPKIVLKNNSLEQFLNGVKLNQDREERDI